MLKVFILTGSYSGTAAHHLPYLLNSDVCKVTMVIVSQNQVKDKKKYYTRKLKKTLKIGILGAVNGVRMRKWFNEGAEQYTRILDVREICKEHNIPVKTVPVINCKETQELALQAGADIGISLGNGYIGSKVFSIPRLGMVNIHHEILPDYQNAQSIIWQIYNGSSDTGYTIHKIDKQIDTGDILYQEKVPIEFQETLPETIGKTSAALLKASALGLLHVLKNIDYLFKNARPQGHGRSYTTPSYWQFLRIYRNFKKLRDLHREAK